jgi:hypothetical protein
MFEENKFIFNRKKSFCFITISYAENRRQLNYFFIIARRSLGVVDIPSRLRFKLPRLSVC